MHVFGNSLEGRPLDAWILGDGPRTVLFLATIHGDEAAGTPLLQRMIQTLEDDPGLLTGLRVVIVPMVNPDGFAAGRRGNANGVDLNRNFPALNQSQARRGGAGALSEPEAAAIAALINSYDPDRTVSIHQPLACVDYDGPAIELATQMSRACDLEVRKLGGRPGSLGTWLGTERCTPVVTFELPRHVETDEEALWEHYGSALLAALRFH